MESDDDLDLVTDSDEWRRRIVWSLRQHAAQITAVQTDVNTMRDRLPRPLPTWVPVVATSALMVLLTYIGIVHNMALRARNAFDIVQTTQQRHLYLADQVKEQEGRLRILERGLQELPFVREHLAALRADMDRLLRSNGIKKE